MKKSFAYHLTQSNRKIVIHDTYLFNNDNILNCLQKNDILFFDDCLYSQYVFIQKNIEKLIDKNIICVIGFSASIKRDENIIPIYEANCAVFHDKVHQGDKSALAAYMSLSEIKILLNYDNVFLAGHGNCHLELEKYKCSCLKKFKIFNNDINEMVKNYSQYGFQTNIFVFPYAYDNILLAYRILEKHNFNHIFAGKDTQRIPIEILFSK